MTARTAPQFSLRPGEGLATIDDLRRLASYHAALRYHQDAVRTSQTTTPDTTNYVVDDDPSSMFVDKLQVQGSRFAFDGPFDPMDPWANVITEPDPVNNVTVLQPTFTRHRSGITPGGHVYAQPTQPIGQSTKPSRGTYKPPRPRGLCLLSDLDHFQRWASQTQDDTRRPPARRGLATRDDLRALATTFAAQAA